MSHGRLDNYFVKFVPFNEKVLSTIINNTIKFSTVYEFNDFNELRYFGCKDEKFKEQIKSICLEKFKSAEFKFKLLERTSLSGRYSKKYLEMFKARLNNCVDSSTIIDEDYLQLQEYLAFSSVGIFCVSSLKVFDNESAQLMFAHYGGNLKGLALIYEISQNILPIRYSTKSIFSSGGDVERIFRWIKGQFVLSDMDDFIVKSEKWDYEQEFRMFSTPKIYNVIDHNIKLKAILYTCRFNEDHIITLKNILDLYKNNIFLQEIFASRTKSIFKVEECNLPITEWLSKNTNDGN